MAFGYSLMGITRIKVLGEPGVALFALMFNAVGSFFVYMFPLVWTWVPGHLHGHVFFDACFGEYGTLFLW